MTAPGRQRGVQLWAIPLALASVGNVARAGDSVSVASTRLVGGLELPVYVTHAPNDFNRLFIVEKAGRIKILSLLTGNLNVEVFLDIDALVGSGFDPGLLGMAFHPDYASNGFFYVHYLDNDLNTVIQRFEVSSNPDIADPESGLILFTLDQPFQNHNGGWIDFGPDGYLYVPLGDGGSQGDPDDRAQDLTDLHGKMLRIDVDADDFPADPQRNYGIPADNPFVGQTGQDEIWAYGLRNPWRCSFDRLTGDLYIADVGQDDWEEIDFQSVDSAGGENYGWRCYEADRPFNPDGCPPADGMVFPIHAYDHSAAGGFSITGGYVYRGCRVPALQDAYFFADFVTEHIWSFRFDGENIFDLTLHDAALSPSIEGFTVNKIASFGEDAAGELYIVEHNGGELFKIIPQSTAAPNADLDCDGLVGVEDFLILLASWGPCVSCAADIDGDGFVGVVDFLCLLAQWS